MAVFYRTRNYLFRLEKVGQLSGMRAVWEKTHRTEGFSGRPGRPSQIVAPAGRESVVLHGVWRTDLQWRQFL